MFQKFLTTYQQQTASLKGMLFLRWIIQVRTIVIAVFTNIYIFQFNQNIQQLIIGNMFYLFHSMVGFLIGGLCVNYRSINIKHLFYLGFFFLIVAFGEILMFGEYLWGMYIFFMLAGTGSGIFFFSSVNYESSDLVDNSGRNFFNSALQAGNSVLKILIPLVISGIFLLGTLSGRDGYHLLFGFTGLVYLYGIRYIQYIPDYIIPKQPLNKLLTYFSNKKESISSGLFFFAFGAHNIVYMLLALILIFILKSEIHIGIYESIVGMISILGLIFIGTKTTQKQRSKIFLTGAIAYIFIATLIGRTVRIETLVLYSLGAIIIEPMLKSFRDTFYYAYQEKIKKYDTYHYGVIFAEIMITAGRIFFLIILLLLSYAVSLEYIIGIGMTLLSANYLFIYRNTRHFLDE